MAKPAGGEGEPRIHQRTRTEREKMDQKKPKREKIKRRGPIVKKSAWGLERQVHPPRAQLKKKIKGKRGEKKEHATPFDHLDGYRFIYRGPNPWEKKGKEKKWEKQYQKANKC